MSVSGLKLGLMGCLAVAAFAGEPGLRRDGAFWVEEGRGSVLVTPKGNIRITTFGAVTVKGTAGSALTYVVVKRVRAKSEAEARRLLSVYRVRSSRQGKLTRLWVEGGSEMAELEVAAPQNSVEVLVETRAGAVDVAQFDGAVIAETGGGRVSADQISGDLVARPQPAKSRSVRSAAMRVAFPAPGPSARRPFTVRPFLKRAVEISTCSR